MARLTIKKKQDYLQWSTYIMELFFQLKLTNEGFKEREEDPLLIRQVNITHNSLGKKYDHKKRFPKFGMATYTKEIVTLT